MRVLAIDTSTDLGSAAILIDGAVRAEISAASPGRHTETVLQQVACVLSEASLPKTSIELLSVGLGPGSFTGTRVGVAVMKGFAIALGCPIVGVSSLRAVAHAALSEQPGRASHVVVAADAHKGEVYIARYENVNDKDEWVAELRWGPTHLSPEDAVRDAFPEGFSTAVCGTAMIRYPERFGAAAVARGVNALDVSHAHPRAAVIAALGLAKYRGQGPDDLATLEPRYVRASDAVPSAAAPGRSGTTDA